MRRLALLVAAVVASIGVLAYSTGVARADDWCWNDPLVKIDGNYVDISSAVQGTTALVSANVASAEYTVHVAPGTPTEVLFTYSPLFPQTVRWVYDGTRNADGSQNVKVDVTFTKKTGGITLPAQLLVYRLTGTGSRVQLTGSTATGTTASPISLTFRLD